MLFRRLALLLAVVASPALAASPPFLANPTTSLGVVVTTCGSAQGIAAGTLGPFTVDVNGNLCSGVSVTVGTIAGPLGSQVPAAGVAVTPTAYTYAHIATSTTTTVKSGAGMLHTVCINTLGTTASTVTVDDALTATTPTVAVINSLALLGCTTYDVAFSVGLTLVTTGTAAPDVTVSYR